jgi:hypothetical protein
MITYEKDYVTFDCKECGTKTTTPLSRFDGFEVCLECRWYLERPWIKRRSVCPP